MAICDFRDEPVGEFTMTDGLPCEAAWHNFTQVKHELSKHLAMLGRKGGSISTPAKSTAARRNALKRWGKPEVKKPLSQSVLLDGAWYRGNGRNSSFGMWDARANCFWTISLNDFADPAHFPAEPTRQVRLKKEGYRAEDGGTFTPEAAL